MMWENEYYLWAFFFFSFLNFKIAQRERNRQRGIYKYRERNKGGQRPVQSEPKENTTMGVC